MSKKIKKTIEEKLEDIGIQQITIDDLLYPRESREVSECAEPRIKIYKLTEKVKRLEK